MPERIGAYVRRSVAGVTVTLIALSLAAGGKAVAPKARISDTQTPIKHLVVLVQENVPFDHYFGTYPNAVNPPGEPRFQPAPDQANHQYDLSDFWAAADAGNLPAVSFLKAPGYQQGGIGPSSPLLEQQYIVDLVNRPEKLPSWSSTAVVVMYDDSDGGYDHVMPPILNDSQTPDDALTGPGQCGTSTPILAGYQGRCGYGPRLPLLIISPWARVNHVDHTLTDQTSIIHFIEDNWLGGERIGDGSYDALSGPLTGMFDFTGHHRAPKLFLNPHPGSRSDRAPTETNRPGSPARPSPAQMMMSTSPASFASRSTSSAFMRSAATNRADPPWPSIDSSRSGFWQGDRRPPMMRASGRSPVRCGLGRGPEPVPPRRTGVAIRA